MLDAVSGSSEYGWAYHIVEELASHADIRLFVLTGVSKGEQVFPPNVTVVRLDAHPTLNLTFAYRLAFVARYYAAARHLLRRERIDLIHHVLPFGYGFTFNLLPILGHTRTIPFVVGPLQAPHTVASSEEKLYSQGDVRQYRGVADYLQDKVGPRLQHWSRSVLNVMSATTLRRSDYLIAVNEQARQLYSAVAPDVPSIVIPPGITMRAFTEVTRAHQRMEGGPEILYVGWLIRRKGVELIIAAVSELIERFPSLRLRLVGDGPQRQALERLVAQHGLTEHVVFEGVVPSTKVIDYYARADLFVSMSYSESFGQSLIEAMATGLPVISALNVGSREIVEDSVTGFLVEAGDTAGLVARLRLLLDHPERRHLMGDQARRVAQQRYDWQAIGQQYLDVYYEALQRSASYKPHHS